MNGAIIGLRHCSSHEFSLFACNRTTGRPSQERDRFETSFNPGAPRTRRSSANTVEYWTGSDRESDDEWNGEEDIEDLEEENDDDEEMEDTDFDDEEDYDDDIDDEDDEEEEWIDDEDDEDDDLDELDDEDEEEDD